MEEAQLSLGCFIETNGMVLPSSFCILKLQSLMVVRSFTGNHVIANIEIAQMCVFVGPIVVCHILLLANGTVVQAEIRGPVNRSVEACGEYIGGLKHFATSIVDPAYVV
jgi:hypothetical protein